MQHHTGESRKAIFGAGTRPSFPGSLRSQNQRGASRLRALAVLAVLAATPAPAAEEALRALKLPPVLVETEPKLDPSFDVPMSSYPLQPVDQTVFRGTRHGFVNTTVGNLAFRVWTLRLPGRMPIDFGLVYDSAISSSMTPPPPGQQQEPRWVHDLGKNWILGYSVYLVPTGQGVLMATQEGELVYWIENPDGTFSRQYDAPTRHTKLQRQGPLAIVETQIDGTKWTYTYTLTGTLSSYVLTQVEDRSGNTITITYNQGYISRIQNSSGSWVDTFRPIFDPTYPVVPFPRSRVVKITDSTGRRLDLDYDNLGRLTSVKDALSNTWTYAYASNDKLITATDPLGNVYLNVSYDSENRVASYEADRGPWSFDYNYAVATIGVSDAFGKTWTFEHNQGTGIIQAIREPELGYHRFTFDSAKNVTDYQGPNDAYAHWTYNADHRPLTYRPPGPGTASVQYTYDTTNGWATSVTALDGGVTNLTRDSAGRVTEERDAGGGRWTATYAANGDRLTLRLPKGNNPDPSGYLWNFSYDAHGNVTQATDPTGRVFEFEYTAQGDLWKVRRPDHVDQATGQVVKAEWVYGRDIVGRTTSVRDPLGNTWTRTYDAAGRLTRMDGPAGTVRRFSYDARHRLTEVIVHNDGINDSVTHLAYDAAGRLVTKTLPLGGIWTYGYDDSGRRISLLDPLARIWTYARDLSGRVISVTYPGGRTVSLTRDEAGRVTQRDLPGGRVETYQYDVAGRLTQAQATDRDWIGGTDGDWTGRLSWTYDLMGRPTGITTYIATTPLSSSRELSFQYDLNGNRVSMTRTLGGGSAETDQYTYDELDRLTQVDTQFWGKWWTTYAAQSGYRTRVNYGNDFVTPTQWEEWDFDLAGRITGHRWHGLWDDGSYSWVLDAEGRSLQENDVLTGVVEQATYGYLSLPIATSKNEGGVITTDTLTYDLDGRLVQSVETKGSEAPVTTSFEWDGAGRLSFAQRNETTATYTWNDAPSDLAVALELWRASNDEDDRAAQIQYGYDGRLRQIIGQHYRDGGPMTVLRQIWAPLEQPLVLEFTEPLEDGTNQKRRMAAEVAGYFSEGEQSNGVQRLTPAVEAIDATRRAFDAAIGVSTPNPEAPYRVNWPEIVESDQRIPGVALTAPATVLGETRELMQFASGNARPQQLQISTLQRMRQIWTDFRDDWLGRGLLGAGQKGDAAVPVSFGSEGMGAQDRGYAGVVQNDNGPVCVWCYNPGRFNDRGIPVNTCEGRVWDFAVGPSPNCTVFVSLQWLVGTFRDPNAWPYYAYGGRESYRYPDLTATGVSLRTGEFEESATDLEVFDAGGGVAFTRTYRSHVNKDGTLGHRWFHNFDERLEINTTVSPEQARWIMPDGQSMDFTWSDTEQDYIVHPESTYRLRRLSAGSGHELRHVSGEVHRFDSGGKLIEIQRKGGTLTFSYGNSRLASVSSGNVTRLSFEYVASPSDSSRTLLSRVRAGTTSGTRYVDYTYNGCDELETVTGPPLTLGYDKDGVAQTAEHRPLTRYVYENPSGMAHCWDVGDDAHRLTEIKRRRFNPLTPELGEQEATYLVNRYSLSKTQGAADFEYMRIIGQCFGKESSDCPTNSEDIGYRYAPAPFCCGDQWGRYPATTTITDRRVAGQTIRETHSFLTRTGELRSIKEDSDSGGLQKHTGFGIDSGSLLDYRTDPDGSCVLYSYIKVGKIWMTIEERERTKERCQGATTGPTDLVTRYTYDEVKGLLRSVTRPEAFPDGTVPPDFDPRNPDYRKYSTFYDYDLNQAAPGPGCNPNLSQLISDWGLACPENLGDVNADPNDDSLVDGNLLRVRRYFGPGDSDHIDTTWKRQTSGRPIWQKRPDGVKVESDYYTYGCNDGSVNCPTNAWDWRDNGGPVTTGGGKGPLAITRAVATDGSILQSRTGWSAEGWLAASQDPAGVRQERRYDGNGTVLEDWVCNPGTNAPACERTIAAHNVLRINRYSYDMQAQRVRSATLDKNLSTLAVSWTTYDVHGNPTTTTVDPNPNATPGGTDPNSGAGYLHLLSKVFYDGRHRPIKTVTPENRATCTTYDALDQPVTVTRFNQFDPGTSACPTSSSDDVTVATVYDAVGRTYRLKDGRGNYTYRWYDAFGRPTHSSDGKPPGARDPILLGSPPPTPGAATWYSEASYDIAGMPTRDRFFGSNGRGATGWLRVSWMEHDLLRRPTKVRTALEAADFVPTAIADLASAPADNPSGTRIATLEKIYRSDGKVETRIDAGERRTDFNYDNFGRLYQSLAPTFGGNRDRVELGFETGTGRQKKLTRTFYDPTGAMHSEVAEKAYDTWGRIGRLTGDPGSAPEDENLITTFEYDALSRSTVTTRRWVVAGSYTGYDPNDRISRAQCANGQPGYDKAGRVLCTERRVKVVGAVETWARTTFTYDKDGLVTSMTDAQQPTGNRTDWVYKGQDGAGNQIGGLGRLLKMLYPTSSGERQTVARTGYDGNGNVLEVEYRKNNATGVPTVRWTQAYDRFDRLESRKASYIYFDPLAATTEFYGTERQRFAYDDLGRMVEATDCYVSSTCGQSANDIVVDFRYDTGGRLLEEDQRLPLDGSLASHRVNSTYTPDGFRTQLQFPESTDSAGNVLARYVLSFQEDALGRFWKIDGPNTPLEPAFGVPNRATTNLVTYAYAGGKVWKRTYANGGELRAYEPTKMLYDELGRIEGLRTVDSLDESFVVTDFRYGYDRVGNLTHEQRLHESYGGSPEQFRTRAHTTDQMGRLTKWREGRLGKDSPVPPDSTDPASLPTLQSDGEEWSLDLLGNWDTKKTGATSQQTDDYAQPNPLNQYPSVEPGNQPGQTKVFTYDWLGQLRTDERADKKFVWDGFGRLTRMRDLNGTLIATYRYDALNRRVEKIWDSLVPVPDPKTRFFYDGWRAIEERAVVSDPTTREVVRARYGFGNGLDEVLWMDRDVAMSGSTPDPRNGVPNGTLESRFYLHHDVLGSVTAITDTQRDGGSHLVVKERFTYASYGKVSAWSGTWSSGTNSYGGGVETLSRFGLPYLYTGQRFDAETGLLYMKQRLYDPIAGRFLRRDLLGHAEGPNLYEYVRSRPASSRDPLGLYKEGIKDDGELVGGTVTFGSAGSNPSNPNEKLNKCQGVSAAHRNCAEYRAYLSQKANRPGPTEWTGDELEDAEEFGFVSTFTIRLRTRELTDEEYKRESLREAGMSEAEMKADGYVWDSGRQVWDTPEGTAAAGAEERVEVDAEKDKLYITEAFMEPSECLTCSFGGQVPQIDTTNLNGLNPAFRAKVEKILGALQQKGYRPYVASGKRDMKQQMEKLKQGTSRTLNSKHLTGEAADIVDRRWGWNPPGGLNDPYWGDLGAAAQAEGLEWGGDWKSFPDPAHVEVP